MKYYTSRSGDSLLRVAVLFYFRHDLYAYLYSHNENAIGPDIFTLAPNTKLAIPDPLMQDTLHVAVSGETSQDLAEKYYGIRQFYVRIDQANDFPPALIPGTTYLIPALVTKLEFDAAADMRRNLSVQFDR